MTVQCFPGFPEDKNETGLFIPAALAWQRGVGAEIYTGSVYYALHISVDTPGTTPCLELYMKRVYASVFLPAQAKHHLICNPPAPHPRQPPPRPTQTHTSVSVCPHSVSTLKH